MARKTAGCRSLQPGEDEKRKEGEESEKKESNKGNVVALASRIICGETNCACACGDV